MASSQGAIKKGSSQVDAQLGQLRSLRQTMIEGFAELLDLN